MEPGALLGVLALDVRLRRPTWSVDAPASIQAGALRLMRSSVGQGRVVPTHRFPYLAVRHSTYRPCVRSSPTAVLMFMRAPEREVKELGLAASARRTLLHSLLRQTLRTIRSSRSPFDLVIAHDGPVEGVEDASLTFAQQGETFGARLLHAVSTVRAAGYERVVMLGTDTPELTSADLDAAVEADSDIAVVGPSLDGGFYLLSIPSHSAQDILADLPWRTPAVVPALTRALSTAGLALRWLSNRRDVDVARDVTGLRTLLRTLSPALVQLLEPAIVWRPADVRRTSPAHLTVMSAQGPPASAV